MSELDQYIAGDPVYSFQLNDRSSELSGELNLLTSIMHDAYNQYILTFKSNSEYNLAKRQELEEWFETDEGIFSFESVCAYLHCNPNNLRRRLNQIKEDMLADPTLHGVKRKAVPSLHTILPSRR